MNKFKITILCFSVFLVRAMQAQKFQKRKILSQVNRRAKRESSYMRKRLNLSFVLLIPDVKTKMIF